MLTLEARRFRILAPALLAVLSACSVLGLDDDIMIIEGTVTLDGVVEPELLVEMVTHRSHRIGGEGESYGYTVSTEYVAKGVTDDAGRYAVSAVLPRDQCSRTRVVVSPIDTTRLLYGESGVVPSCGEHRSWNVDLETQALDISGVVRVAGTPTAGISVNAGFYAEWFRNGAYGKRWRSMTVVTGLGGEYTLTTRTTHCPVTVSALAPESLRPNFQGSSFSACATHVQDLLIYER